MSGLKNSDDVLIPISTLQAYAFCPRRYYLLNIEYNDTTYGNELTEQGKTEHQTVHSGKAEKRGRYIKVHGMQVYSQKLSVIGQCDTVEFYENNAGAYIDMFEKNYDITVVEHKRHELDVSDSDIVQLAAQCMCLEEMYNTTISEAYIYYVKENKKIQYSIDVEIRRKVKQIIAEIKAAENAGKCPPPVIKKYCRKCAAYDICDPHRFSVNKYIEKAWTML